MMCEKSGSSSSGNNQLRCCRASWHHLSMKFRSSHKRALLSQHAQETPQGSCCCCWCRCCWSPFFKTWGRWTSTTRSICVWYRRRCACGAQWGWQIMSQKLLSLKWFPKTYIVSCVSDTSTIFFCLRKSHCAAWRFRGLPRSLSDAVILTGTKWAVVILRLYRNFKVCFSPSHE